MKLPKLSTIISGCHGVCNTKLSDIAEDVGVTTLTVDFLLKFACLNGQSKLVKLLLETTKGLDLNKTLLEVCTEGFLDSAELLIEHGANAFNEAISEAGEKGHEDIVNMIVLKVSNPNNSDEEKMQVGAFVDATECLNSGLIGACNGGYLTIVQTMVDKGATDLLGALQVACQKNHQEIVKYLLGLGPAQWVTSHV